MRFKRVFPVIGMVALATACSDGTGPGADGTVSLSFATQPGGAAAQFSSTGMLGDPITVGGDVLVITRAQVVLRDIELKLQDDDGCESLGMDDDDGCEEFSTGAMLVDLPVNGDVTTAITIVPQAGVYDQVEFEVHKPESGGDDDAFLSLHSDFDGVSIRVQGTFNGQPFTYESDLDVEQENPLDPPITVLESATGTNVTMYVDVSTWFMNGTSLVDPASANKGGVNEGIVKENIKTSFRSFEDQDRDGDED